MKAIKKLLYFLAVAGTTMFASSCTEEMDYTPAPRPAGQQVYFSVDLPTSYELTEDQSSITIPVLRVVSDEAASFSMFASEESGLFTIPTTVDFAACENTANLVITYDYSKLKTDTEYPCTLSIGDAENTSLYGLSTYEFTLVVPDPTPYVTVSEDAIFVEGGLSKLLGLTGRYTVTVERMQGTNIFRVVSPYSYPSYPEAEDNWTFNSDLYIDATDPNRVTVETLDIPVSFGTYGTASIGNVYGNLTIGGVPASEEDYPLGTYDEKTGVIDLGAMFIELTNLGINLADPFMVYLDPSYFVEADIKLEYQGIYTDMLGKTYAVVSFTPEADVVSYKYAVVDGDITGDEDALAKVQADILSGALAAEEGSGVASKGFELESGEYTLVALAFNNAGENIGPISSVSFRFYPGNVPEVVYSMTMETVTNEEQGLYPYNAIAVKSTGTEIKSIKYLFAVAADVAENVGTDDASIIEYIKQSPDDYYIQASDIAKLNAGEEITSLFSGLTASTEYLCAMYVSNGAAAKLYVSNLSTAAAGTTQSSVPGSSVLNGTLLSVSSLDVVNNGYIAVPTNSIDVNPGSVEKVKPAKEPTFALIR